MEQHIKTDLKLLVKEADKQTMTRVNVPANVGADITEEQALALADILVPILPTDAAFSKVQCTAQVEYIKAPPLERELGGETL